MEILIFSVGKLLCWTFYLSMQGDGYLLPRDVLDAHVLVGAVQRKVEVTFKRDFRYGAVYS